MDKLRIAGGRALSPKVRVFVDFIAEQMRLSGLFAGRVGEAVGRETVAA